MKIPLMFHGTGLVVRKRVASALRKGHSREPSVIDLGPMVDVNDFPEALILVDQSDRNLRGNHFHPYMLLEEVGKPRVFELEDMWFEWSLQTSWALAGLMGSSGQLYFLAADLGVNHTRAVMRVPYLRAVEALVGEMDSVGKRYLMGNHQDVLSRLPHIKPYTILKLAGIDVAIPSSEALRSAIKRYLTENRES